MFERFTGAAREVFTLADKEADELGHGYIGTGHLLLGLVREEAGLAAQVLQFLGVTVDVVRSRVVESAETSDEVAEVWLTTRAKKALELALRESLSLGHIDIGTEHILPGLAREGGGVAAQILLRYNADAGRIRGEVVRALAGGSRAPWGGRGILRSVGR